MASMHVHQRRRQGKLGWGHPIPLPPWACDEAQELPKEFCKHTTITNAIKTRRSTPASSATDFLSTASGPCGCLWSSATLAGLRVRW
jgi:hypothetical protein